MSFSIQSKQPHVPFTQIPLSDVSNLSQAKLKQLSETIAKVKSCAEEGRFLCSKQEPVSQASLLESYQSLQKLKIAKIEQLSTFLNLRSLQLEEIGFIDSALKDLMFIRDQMVHQELGLSTQSPDQQSSRLDVLNAEWKKNEEDKNIEGNHLLLKRMIIDSDHSNSDLYQFLADKIKPNDEGWFVKDRAPSTLALEFVKARKINVEEFYREEEGKRLMEQTQELSMEALELANLWGEQKLPDNLSETSLLQSRSEGSKRSDLVEDSQGYQFIKKIPVGSIQADQIRNEYYTNRGYKALGVDVPEVALYNSATGQKIATGKETDAGDQIVMLIEVIPGKTQEVGKYLDMPSKLNAKKTGVRIEDKWRQEHAQPLLEVQEIAKQSFVADALLSNLDAAGPTFDRLLIDIENKKIWRVGNEGGLEYHAQGEKKSLVEFSWNIKEFKSLLDPNINPNQALLYETLTYQEIIGQIDAILPKRKIFLDAMPLHLLEIMNDRFDYLKTYREKLVAQQEILQQAQAFILSYQQNPNMDYKAAKTGLSAIISTSRYLTDPRVKTAIFTICERVAQAYIEKGDLEFAMKVRMSVAQSFPPAGPLANLQFFLDKEDPKLGSHLYPVDTGLFKNQALMVQRRTVEGQSPHLHLEAKLGHPARANLQSTLDLITKDPNLFYGALPKDFCKGVTVTNEKDIYHDRKPNGKFSPDQGFVVQTAKTLTLEASNSRVIHFQGVGTVRIGDGTTTPYAAMQNRISIDLDPSIPESEAAEKLAILFSALGLGSVTSVSRPVDEERIKILQLFRAFYPADAYPFERDPNTFKETIESLTSRIKSKVPGMKAVFQQYLVDEPNLMYQQEVYPGESVWCIKGLADDVRKVGGIGLMSGVTAPDFTQASQRLVSILRSGALSTQDRFQVGITIVGDSSGEDLRTGGGGAVFARMITKNMPKTPTSYPLRGKLQILYDLSLVERVGYAYGADKYGTKEQKDYAKRANIVELTKQYQNDPWRAKANELCINHRVGPKFIKGILVENDNQKDELVKLLTNEGLLTVNNKNETCFNEIPIDQFIHVGDFDEKHWA